MRPNGADQGVDGRKGLLAGEPMTATPEGRDPEDNAKIVSRMVEPTATGGDRRFT